MKNFLILLLVMVSCAANAQVDLSEKIPGNWVLEHTKITEQLPSGVFAEKTSGFVGKATVYFKANNTGNFNVENKDSEPFTWTIVKKKIVIVYEGKDEILKSFNGDFRAVYRERKGEQKLDLTKNNLTVSLSRKL